MEYLQTEGCRLVDARGEGSSAAGYPETYLLLSVVFEEHDRPHVFSVSCGGMSIRRDSNYGDIEFSADWDVTKAYGYWIKSQVSRDD